MIPVSAAAMEQGAYRRCYDYLIKLQILDEIESMSSLDFEDESAIARLFEEWKTRLTFSQYALGTQEPVLKIRRALIGKEKSTEIIIIKIDFNVFIIDIALKKCSNESIQSKLKTELSECWLMSAKVARKAGQLNKAYNLLLEAQKFSNKEVFIETAKLSWARMCKTEAIATLEKGITDQFPSLSFGFDKNIVAKCSGEDLNVCGKAKLLLARYVDEAANLGPEIVPTYYNEAKTILSHSEDVFYHSARFFDKIIGKNYEESELDVRGDIVCHIMMQYVRSLLYGCNHLHQSLGNNHLEETTAIFK